MATVHIRPTHYTYHREGKPPRVRIQSDAPTAWVRIEFAATAQLLLSANANQRTPQTYFDTWAGADGAAGQQLRLNNGRLTYDMPPTIWGRLAEPNHFLFYRVSASTAGTPNWAAQPPATIYSVTDAWVTRGIVPYFGIPHDQLHDLWPFPDMGPYGQVDTFYRSKLQILRSYHETNEGAYLLRRLVGHDNYTSLPDAQRAKALTIFAATNNAARRAFLQLFGRQIPSFAPGAQPQSAVTGTDLSAQRKTLLDNLETLVTIDPHMSIPETMDTVIADLIEEVADPHYELNQGTKGTCVPTSVQWLISTYFPAEYVRLLLTLLTQTGQATLANGSIASTPPDTYQYDPNEQNAQVQRFLHRSWSERIFQATMMNYSRPGLTYSNLRDVFTDNRGGLTASELVRLMQGLRNVSYTSQSGPGNTMINALVQQLQRPALPVLTTSRWGQGHHEVVSVAADTSTITIRNPWGHVNYSVGQQHQNPPRRSSNPSRGEETLTKADFTNWITSIVVEQL